MMIENVVVKAKFVRRPNRFVAYVIFNNEEIMVHVPNTGRCREILIPGCTVVLRESSNPNRKTKYDLIGAYKGNKFINIDSQIPNKVVEEALKNKKIPNLVKYNTIMREKTFGNSRFDFRLENDSEVYFLEVKGVTLEDKGFARFPDAPTERGSKHLNELVEAKKAGYGAGILFLIQMDNIKEFTPNDEMDENFGTAVRNAASNGVDIMAYECSVKENSITLNRFVRIIL